MTGVSERFPVDYAIDYVEMRRLQSTLVAILTGLSLAAVTAVVAGLFAAQQREAGISQAILLGIVLFATIAGALGLLASQIDRSVGSKLYRIEGERSRPPELERKV